ncbi:pyridoxal-dependent decarboxylase [Crocinitomicaceae bacterium]|nr:pyridoxal-dependent decarboxylase [Crocinitomicaceae bacterium]
MWKKLNQHQIKERIFDALQKNRGFRGENVLGLPASFLDSKVFSPDHALLDNAPFLSTMVENPNHIGCHTLDQSEAYFEGTHALEREAVRICAEEIMGAEANSCDGYVASGGTEANLQAIWIYRNYFHRDFNAEYNEIAIIGNEHTHYSTAKAANLLHIKWATVKTDPSTMGVSIEAIDDTVARLEKEGVKYFIVVANMMTTMFGSVDDVNLYVEALTERNLTFKIHVDAAFGGFYYPFSSEDTQLTFENPHINSITMDAHKMAQAPYGTGIFLIRKGWMQYAHTKEASYVEGQDSTLIGSRSGANAIAVWMILMTHGKFGWYEKIFVLQKRTDWLCEKLDAHNINYFRNPSSNIVTIESSFLMKEQAAKFGFVPDNHDAPNWYKIVIMEHVEIEHLEFFLDTMISEKLVS